MAAGGLEGEDLSDNVLGTARLANGDVDAALAASDVVVSGRFETPWMYQGYLETQTATAWLEPEGELVVRSSTQAPFATRDSLAKLFGLPTERVRVRSAPLGGAFGGKMMIIEPLACSAVLAVRKRPVRLALTRSEDIAATNPAGAEVLSVELGANADGRLTGIRARVLVDRGSTDDFGVESIAAMLAAGPYRWPAHELVVARRRHQPRDLRRLPRPAAAPAAFAVESLIDDAGPAARARPAGAAAAQRRRARAISRPRASRSRCSAPRPAWSACATIRCGRAGASLAPDEGIGVAIGWWPGGYEPAAAVCRLDADGRLTVITGAADMTGVETGFAAIAAEAFGVDASRVRVVNADTSSAPYAGTSGGSKVTYTVGRAVERAAMEARERLLEVAADELEISPLDLEIVDGTVQPVGVPAKALPIERAGVQDPQLRQPPHAGGGPRPLGPDPGAAGRRPPLPRPGRPGDRRGHGPRPRHRPGRGAGAEPGAGGGPDAGRHRAGPGLGAARGAGPRRRRSARPPGRSSTTRCRSPTGTPPIDAQIVEVPAPEGPYGAKGVGEAPIVGVAAAVGNAIAAATGGVRLTRLPMTPERVWQAVADGHDGSTASRP